MQTRIWFVRHAESLANIGSDVIGGRNLDVELSSVGVEQAISLGFYLTKSNTKFDKAHSSTALRAQETYRLSLGVEPIINHSLLGQDHGDFTGLPRSLYKSPEVAQQLKDGLSNRRKGESQRFVAQRMVQWLKNAVSENQGSNIIVFTHGLAISFMLAELENSEHSVAYKRKIENSSITELRFPIRNIVPSNTEGNESRSRIGLGCVDFIGTDLLLRHLWEGMDEL